MEQDIIEVPYSDSVPSQVITIDLPHPPSVPNSQNVQTIIYQQDGHSMTQLQPTITTEEPTTRTECNQLETKITLYNANNNNNTNNNTSNDTSNNNDPNNTDVIEAQERSFDSLDEADENNTSNGSRSLTRFKWTKEKSQVALNLVKHGCKPKLVSVAVGCSLRTAQKFVETVTPKMEGESFKDYEIRRRGRKSKDVNQRLEAIREVLSKDSTKTQVEIAADLKVSNTTVCRDLKRIGASWREKKNSDQSASIKRETKKDRQSTSKKLATPTKNKTKVRQKKSPKKSEAKEVTGHVADPALIKDDNNH